MKRLLFSLFLLASVSSLLTSCSPRIAFTQAIREQYRLTDAELKTIQFYASGDIVLQRGEKDESGKETEEGKLVISSGSSMEQVVIKAGTPGVVESVLDNNRVSITFEDGKYLIFGDPLDKKGPYTLLAAEWKEGRGTLEYGGKSYHTLRGSSNVNIMFKMKSVNRFRKDERVVKGKKL